MSTSLESVSFPSTDSAHFPAPVTHLPFRRISLPSAPSSTFLSAAQHRHSAASLASFELPEEPILKHHKRRSLNPRHSRTLAPLDAAREAKRAKIIREFWDTERSYLDGLDLVHDVTIPLSIYLLTSSQFIFLLAFFDTDHRIPRYPSSTAYTCRVDHYFLKFY